MSTVRDLVRSYQREIRDSDLLPDRAAVLLTKLSAILGNISDEIREADMTYAVILLKHLELEDKANRAKIRAETTPEYERKREARDLEKLALSMIGGLKYYLRSKEEEMRLTR